MIKFLQIEPTTRCNLDCSFCSGRSMVPHDISITRFDEILDFFPNLLHVELQGEGEPLMHPDFFP